MARRSLWQVCLLPLTPDTKHIINSKLLAWLPKVRLCWCRLPSSQALRQTFATHTRLTCSAAGRAQTRPCSNLRHSYQSH